MDADEIRRSVDRLRAGLLSERSSFDSHWRELSEYLMPRRSRFLSNDRNRGEKRNTSIIDSTGRFAVRTLQSGLHAGLTSPARPWFQLTTPDPQLRKRKDVKTWLEDVTQLMRAAFIGSNIYNCLPIIYGDMGVFGTAALAVVEDEIDLFRCYAYPIGSYCVALDGRNLVSTFMREYELSVRQVVDQFGRQRRGGEIDWSHISERTKANWTQGQYEVPVTVSWVVLPNPEYNPGRLESQYKRFASYHWEVGVTTPAFLRQRGYDEFPVMVPRWDITGEDSYGTSCPGMDALGDVRQLQMMEKEKGKAIKKLIDPPMVGTPELRSQKTSILPGDITYVREPQHGFRAAHEVGLNLEHFSRNQAEVRVRIQRAFYEDLFLMIAMSDDKLGAARPTATEIQERHEEKLLALGPVLERTNDELLNPIIDRVFAMMDRNGLIPPAPEVLSGAPVKVEYLSIMAAAQKLVGVASQDRFVLGTIAPMAQVFPEVLDKIDSYQIIDTYADQLSMDPRSVRTNEEANKIGQERAKAAQAAAQAQQAQQVGSAVKNLGTTPVGTDSVLDRLGASLSGAVPPVGA
jgi:hypothetical protein